MYPEEVLSNIRPACFQNALSHFEYAVVTWSLRVKCKVLVQLCSLPKEGFWKLECVLMNEQYWTVAIKPVAKWIMYGVTSDWLLLSWKEVLPLVIFERLTSNRAVTWFFYCFVLVSGYEKWCEIVKLLDIVVYTFNKYKCNGGEWVLCSQRTQGHVPKGDTS